MALPVKVVCVVCLVILSVYLQTVDCDATESTCYCLTKELDDLRNPVHIETTEIDGKQVYFIAEQIGVINIYTPVDSGNQLKPYIDVTEKVICEPEVMEERGLLGFALHPNFSENKKVYLYTIRQLGDKQYAVISEVVNQDVQTESMILLIEQPGEKRNGGQVKNPGVYYKS